MRKVILDITLVALL